LAESCRARPMRPFRGEKALPGGVSAARDCDGRRECGAPARAADGKADGGTYCIYIRQLISDSPEIPPQRLKRSMGRTTA
ncbi:MAG TPA: hypothetical protein P5568_13730, partial [Acidobacteriota bacterium]|nr:hypothetical protein [Acidobacteriota bacterium]